MPAGNAEQKRELLEAERFPSGWTVDHDTQTAEISPKATDHKDVKASETDRKEASAKMKWTPEPSKPIPIMRKQGSSGAARLPLPWMKEELMWLRERRGAMMAAEEVHPGRKTGECRQTAHYGTPKWKRDIRKWVEEVREAEDDFEAPKLGTSSGEKVVDQGSSITAEVLKRETMFVGGSEVMANGLIRQLNLLEVGEKGKGKGQEEA